MTRFNQRVGRRLVENAEFRSGFDEGRAEFALAHALDEARIASGLSKADLARRIGRERAFVSRKLTQPGNMEMATFALLLQSMGKRADIVIGDARRGAPALRIKTRAKPQRAHVERAVTASRRASTPT